MTLLHPPSTFGLPDDQALQSACDPAAFAILVGKALVDVKSVLVCFRPYIKPRREPDHSIALSGHRENSTIHPSKPL